MSKECCPQGHIYSEVGFYVINDPRGGSYRRCKRCHAGRAKEYRAKKAERGPRPKPKRKPKPFASLLLPCILESVHGTALSDLAEEVKGRLKIVCWDLGSQEIVDRLRKRMEAEEKTVHFFSDEWVKRREQCRGFVRARAGLFEHRFGARKCELREVPKGEAVAFLEAFHIQGRNRLSIVCFGLYAGAELLGLLSLGRHSRQIAQNRIVLDRLCFRAGVQVVGGSSKLLKAAVGWSKEQSYDEVITYSDNRWAGGNLYEQLGFKLDWNLKPDYCYVKDGNRFSKQSQKKKASKCPETMTELEWATFRGLRRIYDAGKKRWVLNLWPGLHETRNELSSERCARQHQNGIFKHSHIRGQFASEKNETSVYFGSSYELRCLFLLEADPRVASFRRCEAFKGKDSWRNPDLWVEFMDGTVEIWEVKPEDMLSHFAVQKRIQESELFAASNGMKFRLWTEKNSGLGSCHEIIEWARKYLAENGDPKYLEDKKERQKRRRRRYKQKIANDKVEVWCDYCQVTHTALRLTYTRNIKRNGKYICERYGGYLAGKRPKDHLKKTNLYAAQGKKQCSTCAEVKPIRAFDVRRASWDGIAPRCKECSAKKRAERSVRCA